MMPVVLVRPATVDDAAALADVHVRTWRVVYRGQVPQPYLDQLDPSRRREEWRQGIEENRPPVETLVLEHDVDGIVGFVHVAPSRDSDTDPQTVGEIQALYVLPTYWGRGAGRTLMEAGLRRLADGGRHEAILWVLESNVRARRFYETGNWVADGSSKRDDSRGFPLVEIRYRRRHGDERRLPGGNTGGAVRIGDTVRRAPGQWTPSVHAVLRHLESVGFDRAPRALGFDDQGREILSFLPGDVVGDTRPWPAWVHSDDALRQAAVWLRDLHAAVASFVPRPDAVWREGGAWRPGLIIGHNDAAPYNAAWADGRLVGFFDWDFAGPVTPEWDLAFMAFAWVPLHARHVVAAEGFTDFADRPRRLRLFLDTYGWSGSLESFVETVRRRVRDSADGIRRTAAAGDPAYRRMIERGVDTALETAADELAGFPDR